MIKLTPEHVGTRVLLDNGCIGVVTSYFKIMAGARLEIAFGIVSLPFSMAIYDDDGIFERDEDHEEYERGNTDQWRVVLSFDAPNPLDVPVPEWCEDVVVWYHDEAIQILDREQFQDWRRASHVQPAQGWSPAPGQLPPREDAA